VESEAGGSARAEAARRRAARETQIRSDHPKLGGLILALTDEPQHIRAWDTGAAGEERVGRALDALPGVRTIHDRIVPGRQQANLDHLVVTRSGLLIVDTKSYRGRIDVSAAKLRIAGRDQTKLVTALQGQVAALEAFVGAALPVSGCLCFVKGDFTLIAPSKCQGVRVIGMKGLTRLVKKMSNDDANIVDAVAAWLDANLRAS